MTLVALWEELAAQHVILSPSPDGELGYDAPARSRRGWSGH